MPLQSLWILDCTLDEMNCCKKQVVLSCFSLKIKTKILGAKATVLSA